MTDDLLYVLRAKHNDTWPIQIGHGDLINQDGPEAADEIERLTKKCDMQAMILRRLTPENHPDTLFIHGTLGEKDDNNMPKKLLVVPAYGVDFSYVYEYNGKVTGPEW